MVSCLEFLRCDLDAYSFQGQLKSEKEAPFWVPAQLLSLVRMQFLFFLAIRSDCWYLPVVMIYEATKLSLQDVW